MAKMANLARNSLRAGENVHEITRGAPCIVEKLTKMEKLPDINGKSGENAEYGKICHRFGKYSNWIPKTPLGEWRK